MDNPLSKTTFGFEADRIQHYTNELYECANCKYTYHPKVHSQPYIVQIVAIVVALAIVLGLFAFGKIWLYAFVAVIALPYLAYYRRRARRVSNGSPKYGDIILECPKCGAKEGAKAV